MCFHHSQFTLPTATSQGIHQFHTSLPTFSFTPRSKKSRVYKIPWAFYLREDWWVSPRQKGSLHMQFSSLPLVGALYKGKKTGTASELFTNKTAFYVWHP